MKFYRLLGIGDCDCIDEVGPQWKSASKISEKW